MHPNLEQLRKQAKELARAAKAGDAGALARLGGLPPRLASAQLVLAREAGYASWPALVHALDASAGDFVVAATEGRRGRAEAYLAARPEIRSDRWARLVLGEGWDGDPNEVGGPRAWPPLHYLAHSAYGPVELARALLRRGADPNAAVPREHGGISALFGAVAVARDLALVEALLDGGADPNGEPVFGDALYHAAEVPDPAFTRVLLAHGAEPRGTNALAHALDFDRIEQVRLLLDAGADASGGAPIGDTREGSPLVHAVRRGRRVPFLRLLVESGADLEGRGSEGWRVPPPTRLRTAYQHAVLRGMAAEAAYLAVAGASTVLDAGDAVVAALCRGERPAGAPPGDLDYDQQEALIRAVLGGHCEGVVEAVGPNFQGVLEGYPVGSFLHHAAIRADVALVARLLELGADPAARNPDGATALGWVAYGSAHERDVEPVDYVPVAELLLAAGAPLDERVLERADGALRDYLVATA